MPTDNRPPNEVPMNVRDLAALPDLDDPTVIMSPLTPTTIHWSQMAVITPEELAEINVGPPPAPTAPTGPHAHLSPEEFERRFGVTTPLADQPWRSAEVTPNPAFGRPKLKPREPHQFPTTGVLGNSEKTQNPAYQAPF